MIASTISDTKNKLSKLLASVRNGETLIILDRKKPVARVERIEDIGSNPNLVLARKPWKPEAVLKLPLAKLSAKTQTLTLAVAEERESGW